MAVKRPGLIVEECSVDQLGQAPVQFMRRNPFGEPKACHLLIEVLLIALHPYSTNPRPNRFRLLQQPLLFSELFCYSRRGDHASRLRVGGTPTAETNSSRMMSCTWSAYSCGTTRLSWIVKTGTLGNSRVTRFPMMCRNR